MCLPADVAPSAQRPSRRVGEVPSGRLSGPGPGRIPGQPGQPAVASRCLEAPILPGHGPKGQEVRRSCDYRSPSEPAARRAFQGLCYPRNRGMHPLQCAEPGGAGTWGRLGRAVPPGVGSFRVPCGPAALEGPGRRWHRVRVGFERGLCRAGVAPGDSERLGGWDVEGLYPNPGFPVPYCRRVASGVRGLLLRPKAAALAAPRDVAPYQLPSPRADLVAPGVRVDRCRGSG